VRHIEKRPEPRTVTDTRRSSTTSFSTKSAARTAFDHLDKAAVRRQLVEEQGGLCAFCMKRIHDGSNPSRGYDGQGSPTTRIAHRTPIDAVPGAALDWTNLLGCCDGGERSDARHKTCDLAQGASTLAVDPTKKASVSTVRYERRAPRAGLFITSDDAAVRKDVDGELRGAVFEHGTLRLNSGDLPELREAAWRAFQQRHKLAFPNGPHGKPAWRAFLPTWRGGSSDRLPEMLGVVEARLL